MRSRLFSLVALVVVLGLVAAACGGGGGGGKEQPAATGTGGTETGGAETEGGTMQIGEDTANNHGEVTVSGDEQKVELDDFYFEPTVIKGSAGATVKLEMDNEGSSLHNFTLEDQNIDQDVEAGEDASVTVTIPDSGFLEFFCKYHRGQGMVGELAVA